MRRWKRSIRPCSAGPAMPTAVDAEFWLGMNEDMTPPCMNATPRENHATHSDTTLLVLPGRSSGGALREHANSHSPHCERIPSPEKCIGYTRGKDSSP